MISFFKKVDRTAIPDNSVNLDDVFNEIKNPEFKKLIELARKSGKSTPTNFNSGTYYLDYDEYHKILKYDYIVKELNDIIDNTLLDVVYYSERLSAQDIKKSLTNLGVKYSDCVKIEDFYSFFEYKNYNVAFICLVWGGFDTIKQEKTGQKGEFKVTIRNMYNFIKSAKTPVVTWNADFDNKRSLKNIKSLSGYIYMDVDDFSVISQAEVRRILTDNALDFVKAVWDSFGGNGIGFLVKVDNLTVDNFKWTWTSVVKKFDGINIKIDKATKDITRINVLSYDENIFIRENCNSILAIEEKPQDQLSIKVSPLTDEFKNDVLEQSVSNLYFDESFFNTYEDRLAYRFYQVLFSKTNHIGITLDETFAFLLKYEKDYPNILNNKKYSRNEIYSIGKNQYDSYADQFGTVTVETNHHLSKDYILVNIYKEYSGDVKLKLHDILEKAILKESNDMQAALVYLILNAKRTGILMKDLSSFIEKKYGYNPENTIKIKKIYTNSKYPFGIVAKLKPTVIQERRQKFIEKAEAENKKVIISESLNFAEQTKIVTELFNKIFGQTRLTDKNIIFLVKTYFKECNSFGISLITAREYLNSNANFHSIERYSNHYGNDIYEMYKVFFGLRIITLVEDKKKINNLSQLKNDQKLSDINLSLDDNTILWADTGMGKTTWACTEVEGKKIILVPTIGALKNIEHKYKAASFYETNKNVSEKDQLIVCTYSSAPTLFKTIKSWKGGLKEYILIVDEQHNFAVSSSKNYRNKELNYVLDNIDSFKKRIFMTGTYFPVEHPSLKEFKIHRVKWEDKKVKNATVVFYENKIKAIESRLVRGKKNIIYLQDKRMDKELGKLITHLKSNNWDKIHLLNSNQKKENHFKDLLTTEYLQEDAEIIITTSITIEAINILNKDVETIHFMTFENPRLMEQMVNRMREKLPSNIFIYKKIKTDKLQIEESFNAIAKQKAIISNAESLLNYLSNPKQKKINSYDEVAAQKLFANQIFENSSIFKVNENLNVWEIDYLSIANKVFNEETKHSKNNFDYFKSILNEYGWEFNPEQVDLLKMTAKDKKVIKEEKEKRSAEMLEYSLDVLNFVSQSDIDSLKKEVDNKNTFDNKKYPDIEWNIRIKVLKLSKYMSFNESCKLVNILISEYDNSDIKFNKAMREVAVKIARESGVFNNNLDFNTPFSKAILRDYFNIKKKNIVLSNQDVISLFNKRKNLLDVVDGEMDAFKILRKYFEIKSILHKGEIKFKLGGLNVSNDVSKFTAEFYEWIKEIHSEQKILTSIEIANQINLIRSKLPFLSKFKLSNKQALALLEDYVTIKKTTKKSEGKIVTSYKVIDLEPKMTKGIEVKINQKIIINNLNEIQEIEEFTQKITANQ